MFGELYKVDDKLLEHLSPVYTTPLKRKGIQPFPVHITSGTVRAQVREGEKLWVEVEDHVHLTLHGGLGVQHDTLCWGTSVDFRMRLQPIYSP